MIRIEMLAFRNVESIRRFEVISGHDVVDIVDSSWSHSDFGEIDGPNTSIGIFGLILGEIGWIDVIVDVSVSLIPLLIVILLEMMMCRMNCEVFANPSC